MKKLLLAPVVLVMFVFVPKLSVKAQTFNPVGPGDSNQPSYSQSDYLNMAIDPSGTTYVAYVDYTVGQKITVTKYNGTSWGIVGKAGFSAGTVSFTTIAFNGSTPYVAFQDMANGGKATVMKFDGTNWVVVGTAGFSSNVAIGISLVINGGVPYVVYSDNQYGGNITVMAFDGTNWNTVGAAGFGLSPADGISKYIPMAFNGSSPYVVCEDSPNDLSIMQFNGTNWVPVGTPGFNSTGTASLAFNGAVPYVAFQQQSGPTTVITFDGTNWAAVGSITQAFNGNFALACNGNAPYLFGGGGPNGEATAITYNGSSWVSVGMANFSSPGQYTNLSFYNGTAYVAYSNQGPKAIVEKFDGTNWVRLGVTGILGGDSGGVDYLGPANISALQFNGTTPYIAYNTGLPFMQNSTGQEGTVVKFDGTNWISLGAYTTSPLYQPSLAFNGNTPYVGYQDGGGEGDGGVSYKHATVKQYNGSSWTAVGTVGFSNGPANGLSMAINNGTPYVAYSDGYNGLKVVVMQYNGSSWVPVGPATGFSAGRAGNTSLAFLGSTPYVAYADGTAGYKVTVMKFNGTSWVLVGTAGFSTGEAYSTPSLVFNGTVPTVVYEDGTNNNSATVMQFNGAAWVTVGNPGFTGGEADYPSMAFNGSTPYVVYEDGNNYEKVTMMKFNGTNWVMAGSAPVSLGVGTGATSVAVNYGEVYTAYNAGALYVKSFSSPSSVATLNGLAISTGTLSPAFATGTTTYTASVGNTITSIMVTPTTTDASATVTVNGATVASGSASGTIALGVGNNTISTTVTAADGVTTQTYTITVNRAASTVATLTSLTISSGTLSPAFASATTSYTASVANSVSSIALTPTTTDATATVTINGTPVTSGTASSPIALNVGTNTITIVVTAQDGITNQTYTVTVTRAPVSTALDKVDVNLTASATYSLRQLKTTYAHTAIIPAAAVSGFANSTTPVIRARRSSDNALLDIGYTANGDLDTATLKSFVGTGGGYIAIWYDQGGNSYDVAQSNYSQQPIVVTNGTVERSGTRPTVRFVNAAQTVLQATVPASSMFGSGYMGSAFPVYEACPANINSSVFGYGNIPSASGIGNDRWQVHGMGGAYFDVGDPAARVYVLDNSYVGIIKNYTYMAGQNLQAIYVNGVLKASSTAVVTACTQNLFNIGGIPNFYYYHDGHASELILYGSTVTATDQQTVQNNQATYYNTLTAPAITAFSPQSGGPGTQVTISGSNFTNATSVYFGGIAAASFTVNADNTITATVGQGARGNVTVTTPSGTASMAGGLYGSPLDKTGLTAQAASAAYSLRQLKTIYTHTAIVAPAPVGGFANSTTPVIRARRSGDNALLDIGYTANGDLDTATLKSFVGTGGGYIAIWYDQSGNSYDVSQANNANQPIVVTNGRVERSGAMPAARFYNSIQTVLNANIPASTMFGSGYMGTVFPVYEACASNINSSVFGYGNVPSASGVGNDRWQVHGMGGAYFDVGDPSNRVFVSNNSLIGVINTYTYVAGVNQQAIYVNGILQASSNSPVTACYQSQFNIGGIPNFGYYHEGHESEVILYGSTLAAADQQAVQGNQNTYYMPAGNMSSMSVTIQQPQATATAVNLSFAASGGSGTTVYALQKQGSTGSFATIAAVTGPGTGSYASADADPTNGDNFYKVTATDSKGNQAVSETVRFSITNARGTAITPNPVLNKLVTIGFNKMPQGEYTFVMVSMSGTIIGKQSFAYDGVSPSVSLTAPQGAHTGVYLVTVSSAGYKRTEKVVVE